MKGKDLVTLSVLLHVFMSFLACNDQPLTRIPPKTVVPYPTQMATSGDTLWVSGANADGKYSYGRLMGLSLKKIFLQPEKSDEPIDLSAVLDSNTLIPSDIGKISIANDILVFASLASGKIYAQKLGETSFLALIPMRSSRLASKQVLLQQVSLILLRSSI